MSSAPSVFELSAPLECLLCGRKAATIRGDEHRATVHVRNPLHADQVRRLVCPDCGGRLMRGDAEWVTAPRASLTYITCHCGHQHVRGESCRVCNQGRRQAEAQRAYRERQKATKLGRPSKADTAQAETEYQVMLERSRNWPVTS